VSDLRWAGTANRAKVRKRRREQATFAETIFIEMGAVLNVSFQAAPSFLEVPHVFDPM
jgi:hypothetical protein